MYFREDGYLSSGSKRKGKIVFTSPKAFQRNKINMVLANNRIIPKMGYVRGNLIWVCCRVNRIKSDCSLEFLKEIVHFYENIANNHLNITSQP